MAWRTVLALGVALSTAGCAAVVPQYDIPARGGVPSINTIESHVRCELGEVALSQTIC